MSLRIKSMSILTIIAFAIAISFLREPLYFLEPRVWAEEGVIYFQSVFSNGYTQSLILPHLGYYSFFNNYVASLSLFLLGLDRVAFATTYSSFFVIILTVFAPFILDSRYWDTLAKKILIFFFSLLIGPAEIWLNTINSQFYFGLFSCLLLLSESRNMSFLRGFYVLLMLVNASFTGITSVILFPFFLFKLILLKRNKLSEGISKFDYVITLVIFLGLVTQLYAFYLYSESATSNRLNLANIVEVPFGIIRTFSLNFGFYGILGYLVVCVILLISCYLGLKSRNRISSSIVLLLACYVGICFTVLSLDMRGGGRYGYVPGVLFFIFLLQLRFETQSLKYLKHFFVSALLFHSAVTFSDTKNFYNRDWIRFSLDNVYVAANGNLQLMLFPQWPNTNWVITVPHQELAKVFDENRYLELNPDVQAAGVDPYEHYLEFGIKEGRQFR